MASRRGNGKSTVLIMMLVAAWLSVPLSVRAQSETPSALVEAVNALRALHGLQPYTVDPWLMAYAQEHSQYQASTKTSTHVHSDGTRPLDIGLEENVASGNVGVFTVDVAVYQVWSDWGHRHILTGYADGQIGAGVAFSDDGFVYYTVNIRPGQELPETEAPFVGLQTSTPNLDGSVIHVVGYGETLWHIALSYGVSVDEIRRLNGIAGDSTVIQPGQRLIIRAAGAGTAVPVAGTPTMTGQSKTTNPWLCSPGISAAHPRCTRRICR